MIRFYRFNRGFDLRVTRWFYVTNCAYPGERQWYVRIGRRPGHVFTFGKVVV